MAESFFSKTSSSPELFGKLFEMRDTTHLSHLNSTSYAEHMALGAFYDSLLGLTDGIIESYQGIYGLQSISIPRTSSTPMIPYLKECYKWIDSKRSSFKESFIQNQIDTVQELIASTLYKLQFLK